MLMSWNLGDAKNIDPCLIVIFKSKADILYLVDTRLSDNMENSIKIETFVIFKQFLFKFCPPPPRKISFCI